MKGGRFGGVKGREWKEKKDGRREWRMGVDKGTKLGHILVRTLREC